MTDTAINTGELLNSKKKHRIWELDFFRGICVLLMIWDHFMFDIYEIFGEIWVQEIGGNLVDGLYELSVTYFTGTLRETFHPIIFSIFFAICGISCSFSKNNLLRGIQALILAYVITIFTTIIDIPIRFGVLHMLGYSILLWWLIDTLCRRNKYATAIVSFALGCIIIILSSYLDNNFVSDIDYLPFLHDSFNYDSSYSADYFPLMPHAGVMLLGASVAPFIYNKRKSLLPWLDKYHWHSPISFCGKHALPVYVLHQVIINALLMIISYIYLNNFIIF